MKDKLGEKIMIEFAALMIKTYRYLTDENSKDGNAKGTKSVSETENLNVKIINIAYGQLTWKWNKPTGKR